MTTSLSHSCGVHGWPCQVNENGSTEGTEPFSTISRPAVTCQKKSASWSPLASATPTRMAAATAPTRSAGTSGVVRSVDMPARVYGWHGGDGTPRKYPERCRRRWVGSAG